MSSRLLMNKIDTIPNKRFKTAFRKGWQAGINNDHRCPYKKKHGGIAYTNAWEKGFEEGVKDEAM